RPAECAGPAPFSRRDSLGALGPGVALRETLLDPHRDLAKHSHDRSGRIVRAFRARTAIARLAIADGIGREGAQLIHNEREVAVQKWQRLATLDVIDDPNSQGIESRGPDQRLGVLGLLADSLELC